MIYYPTITQNVFGGVTSQVTVTNTNNVGLNSFLQQASTESIELKSLSIICIGENMDQLLEPISFIIKDPNGNLKQYDVIPLIDNYAKIAQIKNLKLPEEFTFDGNSNIQYIVHAGQTVKIKFYLGKDHIGYKFKKAIRYRGWEQMVRETLGMSLEQKEQIQYPIDPVLKEIKEPEEIKSTVTPERPLEIKEPEEIKYTEKIIEPKDQQEPGEKEEVKKQSEVKEKEEITAKIPLIKKTFFWIIVGISVLVVYTCIKTELNKK